MCFIKKARGVYELSDEERTFANQLTTYMLIWISLIFEKHASFSKWQDGKVNEFQFFC